MLECQMSDIITNIKASQSVSEWEGSGTLCRVIGESLSIIVCMVFFFAFCFIEIRFTDWNYTNLMRRVWVLLSVYT